MDKIRGGQHSEYQKELSETEKLVWEHKWKCARIVSKVEELSRELEQNTQKKVNRGKKINNSY